MNPTADPMALGWQHYQAGRLAEAETAFVRAARDHPAHADAWCMLGIVRRARGDLDGATAAYREALRLRPDFPEVVNNLSNVLVLQGRTEEAAANYRALLRLRPDYPEGHNNLGVALRNLGKLDEAEACYREALHLRPHYPDAANNLGDVLARRERYEPAIEAYRTALRLRPDYPEAHSNLGIALSRLGRADESEEHHRAAIALRPGSADAHYNLGLSRVERGDADGAVREFREAIRLKPGYAEANWNLAYALRALGDTDAALACYREHLRLAPDDPDAHLAQALTWLMLGDYERGWPEYEWRWRSKEFAPRPFPQPRWDGSPLDGRTVLVHAEQGLGDTIQYVRYAPLVKQRGGTVLVECSPALVRLLGTCPGVDRVVPAGQPLPPFDVHVPMMSLPAVFGTTLQTVPASVPYLFPEPELVERWRQELAPVREFKVGICWQGNPKYRGDRHRSVPLTTFAPLARVPGVRLYSLQKGPGVEQLTPPGGLPFEVTDLAGRLDDRTGPFRDSAAVMTVLDLVVSADTAAAHLAGSLGVPVWVTQSAAGHFCWLLDREDSPWYPPARLFRQRRFGAWGEVFDRMADALRERVARRGRIAIDVSPGELIDRITILEIKSERITRDDALVTVRGELAALRATRDRVIVASPGLDELARELRAVNEAIWDVEDGVRASEKAGDFGPPFVELARSVYRLNDRRSALKRRVNELLGSGLREEKGYLAYAGGPDDATSRHNG
jgi:Flp pilus assembly protein TadD